MDQVCSVQEIHGLGNLVDYIAFVLFAKDVLTNKGVKVDVHELKEQVEIFLVVRLDDFLQIHNIGVLELFQEHNLSVGALCIGRILKGIKVLLQGMHGFIFSIEHFPDMAVSPAADFFEGLISEQYMFLDLITHPIDYVYIFIIFSKKAMSRIFLDRKEIYLIGKLINFSISFIKFNTMDYDDQLPCGGYEKEDQHIEKELKALSLEADGQELPKADCSHSGCQSCSCQCSSSKKEESIKEKVNEAKRKVVCKKCKENQAVLVHKNDEICKECLMKNIEYKTRLGLENKIGIRQKSRLLICFSGGLNSICLLNILSNIKSRYQKCPLFSHLECLHIQQQSHLPEGYIENFQKISKLKLNVIKIEKVFEGEERDFKDILNIFKALKKNSNSIDLLTVFREHLIRKFVDENKFDFALLANNGESLASEIFKYFSKGIGGCAPQLTGSEPSFFHYPLKQHLQKELQYYFYSQKLGKYSLMAGQDDLSNHCDSELNTYLNNFITTLQDRYSHTAPAIVRTGDRIRSNISGEKNCQWCYLSHDRPDALCQKCIRLQSSLDNEVLPKWMK